jgi:hypothetical protein
MTSLMQAQPLITGISEAIWRRTEASLAQWICCSPLSQEASCCGAFRRWLARLCRASHDLRANFDAGDHLHPLPSGQVAVTSGQTPSFKPSASKTTWVKTTLGRTAHHSHNTMRQPDDFSHQLPRNRRRNVLDSIQGRCYRKNIKKRFLISSPAREKPMSA